MEQVRSIIKQNTNLTSYRFFTEFLEDVASVYQGGYSEIVFKLFERGDEQIYESYYRIDPLVIPLLLSLIEQLSKFHKHEIPLMLYNNKATINVLEFLYKSDFFFISGDNKNPTFPLGRKIAEFNDVYFGSFSGNKLRKEHRVRAYSLDDDGLRFAISRYDKEEQKRDYLISHYTYKVREHFEELLFDNPFTANLHNLYIDVLTELITNAVLHSMSNAYALMFVDKYKTKFSISDNGIGFEGSMATKENLAFFEKNSLKSALLEKFPLNNIASKILENLFTILETLFYSSLKDRHGLFDLMINVVFHSHGYFRLHCENSQIIISNRMMNELAELSSIRNDIHSLHTAHLLNQISDLEWDRMIKELAKKMKNVFFIFCEKAIAKYSHDIQYSSIRFFPVKFRGVHIEVEIPNAQHDDYL